MLSSLVIFLKFVFECPITIYRGNHNGAVFIPGVAAVVQNGAGRVRLVLLHTRAHVDGHALALLVLHQPRRALTPRDAHPAVRPAAAAAVVVAASLPQV